MIVERPAPLAAGRGDGGSVTSIDGIVISRLLDGSHGISVAVKHTEHGHGTRGEVPGGASPPHPTGHMPCITDGCANPEGAMDRDRDKQPLDDHRHDLDDTEEIS